MMHFVEFVENKDAQSMRVGSYVRIKPSKLSELKEQGKMAGDPGIGKIMQVNDNGTVKAAFSFQIFDLKPSYLKLSSKPEIKFAATIA